MPTRNEPTQKVIDEKSLAAGPKRLSWTIGNVASRDGHQLTARFSATASITTNAADAAMIRETFHGDPAAITPDAVREHFVGTVEPAAFNYLNRRDASSFDDSREVNGACEAIAEALRVAGFGAGVRFMPPFALTVECPSRQREALETAARSRSTAALAHATHAMQQFQRLRDEQPTLSVEQVLAQVGPASESLMPSLLRSWAEQRSTSAIVVTSGEQLVQFTPAGDSWTPQPIKLPHSIGALRCVLPLPVRGERAGERDFEFQTHEKMKTGGPSPRVQGEGGILVGGQSGVVVLPDDQTYRLPPDRISQLGINSVARGSSHIFATHSEFGLFVWPIGQPDAARLHDKPQAKFATLIDEDQCLFAAGDALFLSDGDSIRSLAKPAAAAVVSILAVANEVRVVFVDGTVARWDKSAAALQIQLRLGGSVTLATTIDWLGEPRLLIANDRGEIECVGESSRTRFVSAHSGWRKIVAAADLIVALSLDRTRLVLWRPWEPRQPAAELHVASVTQHRASDVALI